MNKALIYQYCTVIKEGRDWILFMEDGDPYMTLQFDDGEMYSCFSIEDCDMIVEMH